MKTLPLVLSLAALLLMLLGCATTTPAPTIAPAPTTVPAPTVGAVPTTAPIAPTSAPPANVGTDPASLAQAFEAALSAGNLDAVMALIAEDAVFKNTPPSGSTLTGKAEIQGWVKRQIDTKTTGEISDLKVVGDTVYFASKAFRGGSPLASGQNALTVKDGKIVLRDFRAQPPSSASNVDPIAVVQGYISASNAKKIDEALAYFADDAVWYHPLFGKQDTPEKIRARLAIEADRNITFETSNFQAKGENVTWDQKVFRSGDKIDEGESSALVVNGKIKRLGNAPAASQPAPAPTQIATEITDPWGVVVVPKGGAVHIALMGDFNLPFVQGMKIGAQLAVKDFARDLKIEIIDVEDHSSVPWTKGAEDIVANPNFAAAIGPMASNAGLAETEILDKAHIVTISASATADELTARGLQTFNRTYPQDSVQAEYAANYAATTLKFTRGAVVYDDATYGRGLAQAFRAAYEKNGGVITDYVARQAGDGDYGALLKQLGPSKPQFVYFGAFGDVAAEFAKQKNAAGMKEVALLGPDAFFDSELLSIAGADAEGIYATLLVAPRAAAYEAFAKKFADAGGTEAQMSAAPNAYDAMAILLNAIHQVGKVDKNGNFVIGRQALANAVRATKNFAGASGEISFDANGDRTTSVFAMFQAQGAKWVALEGKP